MTTETTNTVERCRRHTEFELTNDEGMVFRALYFSPQIGSHIVGAGVLGMIESEQLSADAKSDDPTKRQRAQLESNILIRAVLKAAMTSPRLSDDDLEFDVEGGRIGYFALGAFAQKLYDHVMGGRGDAEVFRLFPRASEELTSS